MTEQDIFLAVIEITDPQARQAVLEQACAGDTQLQQRVEALVKAHAGANDFLATPALQQLSERTSIFHSQDFSAAANQAEHPQQRGEINQTADDEPISLSFLSPSAEPGSLGRLGHYEIREMLGHGAFGIVFRAFDEKLQRIVAIKVLSPQLAATSPPRKRFTREAQAAARVRHDNVVAIHAVEEHPLPYLVMEYIAGSTLQQALEQQGPIDVANVLRLGQQIASGLAAAHAQGLIHRDIKPSNVLLENGVSGRVKITDFGLARAADDASLTQTGVIAGTPMYMSPEQATSSAISQRSDLFSLGSVLYVMVSGRPPFRAASTLAVLKRVVEDTPRPIPEIIADVPDWLCAIITKLQAKQPEDRFSSASEVAELLGRCLADWQGHRPVRLPSDQFPAAETAAASAGAATVEMAASARRTKRASSGARGWLTAAAVLACLAGALGVTEATGVTELTSTVIRLTTGSGVLVIETDDPGVKVTVDGEEIQIRGAGVEQLTLKPGQYKVAAVKDGSPVKQELVTITRGGREVVRVTIERNPEKTAAADTPSSVNESDADRSAALWLLERQAVVTIVQKGQQEEISVVDRLPPGPVQVLGLWYVPREEDWREFLQKVAELSDLQRLVLDGSTVITDDRLQELAALPRLAGSIRSLNINIPLVTDQGMSALARFQHLDLLALFAEKVTDTGLQHLASLKLLRSLQLPRGITDQGLSRLDSLNLQAVTLCGSGITDAVFDRLKKHAGLLGLHFSETSVTENGILALKQFPALEQLSFTRAPEFTAKGWAALGELPHLASLGLVDIRVSPTGLHELEKFDKLRLLNLINAEITDADLIALRSLPELTQLDLRGNSLTADAISRFCLVRPDVAIYWAGGMVAARESKKPTAPRKPDQPRPFVLLRDGKVVGEFPYAPINLAEFYDGDILEVRGNGPFRLPQFNRTDRGLYLRAGEGYSPVFIPADNLMPDQIWITVKQGTLRLEGCEFRRPRFNDTAIFSAGGDACEIVNCSLVRGGSFSAILAEFDCPQVRIVDSLLISGPSHGTTAVSSRVRELQMENSLFFTTAYNFFAIAPCQESQSIRLKSNTFSGGGFLTDGSFLGEFYDGKKTDRQPLQVIAQNNLFAADCRLLPFMYLKEKTTADNVRKVVTWQGEGNLAAKLDEPEFTRNFTGPDKLGITVDPQLRFRIHQSWATDIPLAERLALIAAFTTQDLPDGAESIGPDWNLIGPGPGYQKTLEAAEQSQPKPEVLEGGPFTLLHPDSPERGFISLPEAVAAAADGDVIELRTNEALVLQSPTEGPGRRLTLRAARGYQPKYVDTTSFQLPAGHDWEIVNLTLRGRFIMNSPGGIRRLMNCAWEAPLTPDDLVSASIYLQNIHAAGADLEVVNCYLPGMITLEAAPNQQVVIRNSVIQRWCVGSPWVPTNNPTHKILLQQSIVWDPSTYATLLNMGAMPPETTIDITAERSIFDGMYLGSYDKPRFRWAGDRNVFRLWYSLWYWEAATPQTVTDLASWQKLWNSDAHSVAEPPLFFDPWQWQVQQAPGTKTPAVGVDFSRFRRPPACAVLDFESPSLQADATLENPDPVERN